MSGKQRGRTINHNKAISRNVKANSAGKGNDGNGGKHNRRKFLYLGGIAAAAGITLPWSAPYISSVLEDNTWAFLEDRAYPTKDEIKQKFRTGKYPDLFIELGNEGRIMPMSRDWLDLINDAAPEFTQLQKEGKIGGPDTFIPYATQRLFGVPDERIYSASTRGYAEKAINLLYDKLKGLDPKFKDIKLVLLEEKQDFSEKYNGKGFIGNGFLNFQAIGAVSKKDDAEGNYDNRVNAISRWGYNKGGLAATPFKHDIENHEWYIFLSADKNTLYAVFSEMIPLSMAKKALEYEQIVDPDESRIAEEAISESLATKFARIARDELGVPLSIGEYEKMEKAVEEQRTFFYRDVAIASDWVNKNGYQNAFDLWMDDPGKFMKAIRNRY